MATSILIRDTVRFEDTSQTCQTLVGTGLGGRELNADCEWPTEREHRDLPKP